MAIIDFYLDPRSGSPYYQQLIEQVQQATLLGHLRPGDQLPSLREVVSQVAVNPNTVVRAYRELEYEGLTITRPGLGTFIAEGVGAAIASEVQQSLRSELERWIRAARRHGMDDRTVAALFSHTLHAIDQQVA